MPKERVLIINCRSERIALLSDSLVDQGYDVVTLHDQAYEDIQRQIHIYHPDYVVMDDDDIVAITTH